MGLTKPRAAQIFNLDYKQSTRVVTATNITLTGGAPNSVDGVNLSLNDRILVTGQTTGSQNGLYLVTTLGSGSNGTWARTSDGNENGEIEAGMIVMVTEGTIYADTQWKLITDDPIVINTTALTFTQNYMANSISGGTSNVVVNSNANVTISSAGTANVLTVSSTGAVVSGTLSVTGNLIGAVNATANITAGNIRTLGVVSATGDVFGKELWSTQSSGDEGGQVNLGIPAANTALTGQVTIDVYQNQLRFFQGDGARGAYIDLTQANVGVGTNLLASGGGGGTPGGANTNVQFNDAGVFGGTAGLTFNKTTNAVATTGTFSATGNITGGNLIAGTGASGNITGANVITANTVTITANITGGNILTTGLISATGNITGGNILGGANVNATTHTGTTVSVTANITGGNILTAGLISATGNITGGNISATTHTGTTVSVTANITGGNILTAGLVSATGAITGAAITGTGLTVSTGNITGGNLLLSGAIIDSAQLDIQTSAANANIAFAPNGTGMVTVSTQLSAVGNVSGGNIRTAGLISAAGAISSSGTGTFVGLTAGSGNVSGGNITTTGLITATGNIQGGNIRTAGLISATGAVTGAAITGTSLTVNSGNITAGNLIISGAIVDSAQLDIQTSAANANIVLTPNGTGVIVVAKDIRNGQATGVGNIGAAGATFNTIFAKATSAQYADLAEMYVSDNNYAPGTVVEFGGNEEITISTQSHSTRVAGIVSTNPSYLMNSAQAGEHVIAVALTGRVPCSVVGTIIKGDRLATSNIAGVAQKLKSNEYEPGCIIGKAMQNYNSNQPGIIEVAVGRF